MVGVCWYLKFSYACRGFQLILFLVEMVDHVFHYFYLKAILDSKANFIYLFILEMLSELLVAEAYTVFILQKDFYFLRPCHQRKLLWLKENKGEIRGSWLSGESWKLKSK